MFRLVLAALCVGSVFGQSQQSPQDLLKQALAFHQQGKLDEAIRDYSILLAMHPEAAQLRSNLGAALAGAGRYDEAIAQYKLALDNNPDPGVRLNLALAYYKSAQYSLATRELETVHAADPSNPKATTLLADCDLRAGENKKAIDLLTPLRTAQPDDLAIAYLLGTALTRDGQTEQGQVVINQIFARGDSAEARLLMGTARIGAREYTTAVTDLKKAVDLNPNLPDAWSYYGLALFSTGDMTGSRQAFLTALQHNPNDFQANLHVGTMLRLDQEYDKALPYLDRAAAVRPGDAAVQYQLALVSLAQGKTEQARNNLEALLKANPSFTEAHVSLATVYYREKRKADGDRERAIVQKLNADRQAQQPGAKLSAAEESGSKPPGSQP